MPKKQLIIIGAGPAGYTAAFLAADKGLGVTLIDKNDNIGGTCLHAGCIPTKTLLHAAKIVSTAKGAQTCGITFDPPQIDINKLRDQKNAVIAKLATGLRALCQQKQIRFINGSASFSDAETLHVIQSDGSKEDLSFDKLIIATGSTPKILPGLPASPLILDATAALEIESIPESFLVIGGGYIGLEIGSVYAGLGSAVTVVEMTEQLLPGTAPDMVRLLQTNLKKTFAAIKTRSKINHIREENGKLLVSVINKKGEEETLYFDKALVSIGRMPRSQDLQLQNAGIDCDAQNFIKTDGTKITSHPNIYAIGDVTSGPMLAHKASHDARIAVSSILDEKISSRGNTTVPSVIFTDPEIACCGISEQGAKEKDLDVTIVKFPWAASGRALTMDKPVGFTKLIIDTMSEKILGVAIVGAGAGELIAEGVLAVENQLTAAQLKKCVHPHPTLSETFAEAAEMFYGQSVHIKNP